MEPFNQDDLSDQELDAILKEWQAPQAPAAMRAALFPATSQSWWKRMWDVRVPLPAAAALAMLLLGAGWYWHAKPETRVVVRSGRLEIPVERTASAPVVSSPAPTNQLRPVAELRPVILGRSE